MKALSVLKSMDTTVDELTVEVKNANVKIRRESRHDIVVTANNLANWSIDNGTVRQTRAEQRIIIEVDPGPRVTNFEQDGFFAFVLRPLQMFSTVISELLACRNSKFDQLEIIVPITYRGGIQLQNDGGGEINFLNGWLGGNVSIKSSVDIRSENVLRDIGAFSVSQNGSGDFHINQIQSSEFRYARSGAGELTLGILSAETFSLTDSSTGDAKIEQINCKNFRADVSGVGDMSVGTLNTESMSLAHRGTGDIRVLAGLANSGSIEHTGCGDVQLRGGFKGLSLHCTGSGNVDVHTD